jgi:hypothetical protein
MKFDAQAILKYLDIDELRGILDEGVNGIEIRDRWLIKYIPDKFLSIKDLNDKKREITFYDAAQFYGYEGLAKSARTYLKKEKMDTETTEFFKEFENTDDFIFHNQSELMEYCLIDAQLVCDLANYFDRKVFEVFNIKLWGFPSNAAIAQELTIGGNKKYKYPKIVFPLAHQYAEGAYHGGWFEVSRVGSFEEVTDIDISSGYPSTMLKLPHWGNGTFDKVGSQEDIEDLDYYGWVLCEFDCPYIPYNGIDGYTWLEMHKDKEIEVSATNRKKYYPDGKRIQIITLLEYRFLIKWGYYVELFDGYIWRQKNNKYPNPFAWIGDAYKIKQELVKKYTKKVAKEMMEYTLSKISMNGGYGKTCQKVGAAKMRNWFYASYITAETRIKVADIIKTKGLEDKLIMIATDGALFDGKIEFTDEERGFGLGSWDIDYYPSALVLASGIYQLGHKESIKTAMRGIIKNLGYDLRALLKKNTDKDIIIPNPKPRPVSMLQALNYVHIYTKEDINVFHDRVRKIRLNTDKKMKWGNLTTFGQLLEGNYRGKRFTVSELKRKDEKQSRLDEF